ncbi:hypothetical protein ACFX12_023546 [Malus domestica]
MTANLNHLNNVTPYNGDEKITIGNGTGLSDKATRKILYQGKSDGGDLFTILVNVFARSFAAKLGKCSAFLGKKVHVSVWHQRLGHPSVEVLAAMLKKSKVVVHADCSQSLCSSCLSGKMSRQPFHVK